MVMLGAIAGEIGKALQKDNERVALRTERAMDALTKELLDEKKARKKKVETIEEAIQRLQSNGYDKVLAASISRGGAYAVQDAVTRAGEARKLGQDANDWYATTAEYSPEQYADMTTSQLANAVVSPVDLSFEQFKDIEGIDKNLYREYMQQYGLAQPTEVSTTERVTVPEFKFSTDDAMTLDIKSAYGAKLAQKFRLEQQNTTDVDDTTKMQNNELINKLNSEISDLREFGIRNGIISDPGFSSSATRTNLNFRLKSTLDNMSVAGDFGTGAIFNMNEQGALISQYDPQYAPLVQGAMAREAADYIDDLKQRNMYGVDADATMAAMGFQLITITEELIAQSGGQLSDEDIGKEAVNYNGHLGILGD